MRTVVRSSCAAAVVPPEGLSPSVLVVDTDDECGRSLAELLDFCGYSVSVAGGGQTALALADPPPDILITELSLPDLDGYELVNRIRERAGEKPLLVIAITLRQLEEGSTAPVRVDLHFRRPADPRVLLPALARFAHTLRPDGADEVYRRE
jgi:CheY-like chemotaxis protein